MNKCYAFTDIHGNYNLWRQIHDYCDETDQIYFLGDAADRGEDGLQIIEELLKDKRICYLKGNHEDFLIKSGPALIDKNFYDINYSLWLQNGGLSTSKSFLNLSYDSQIYLIKRLDKLPTRVIYINKKGQRIFLSHAGFTPNKDKIPSDQDLLWYRKHFNDEWPQDEIYQDAFVVHGHTPVQAFFKTEEPFFYCDNHKIDLDIGTAFSDQVALLDLDTLEVVKIFKDTSVKEDTLWVF